MGGEGRVWGSSLAIPHLIFDFFPSDNDKRSFNNKG